MRWRRRRTIATRDEEHDEKSSSTAREGAERQTEHASLHEEGARYVWLLETLDGHGWCIGVTYRSAIF